MLVLSSISSAWDVQKFVRSSLWEVVSASAVSLTVILEGSSKAHALRIDCDCL
jgi:hypothetical protein